MRNLLLTLVLLTLSFPSLAWTSFTCMGGAKGTELKDINGKVFAMCGVPGLKARSRPASNIQIIDYGPSVEFLPSDGKCNPFKHQPDKSVKVQGTMVRMFASCPNSGNGLYIFPSSEAGTKYIFNTFKTRNQVTFEADSKIFCGNSSTGSCIFKIDTSDFHVIEEEEAFSGGL